MLRLFVRDSEDPDMVVWLDEMIGRANWKFGIKWYWDFDDPTQCEGRWQIVADGRRLRGKRCTEFVLKWGR